ncbi:hypothetical protein Sa4125_09930 [Aureimonas sp. SA4125]|nr:hypothetical protein Sa4125_09930 [Aureimonas sp. SA4125]
MVCWPLCDLVRERRAARLLPLDGGKSAAPSMAKEQATGKAHGPRSTGQMSRAPEPACRFNSGSMSARHPDLFPARYYRVTIASIEPGVSRRRRRPYLAHPDDRASSRRERPCD